MIGINNISSLFDQKSADQYISPKDLGVSCAYEIKGGVIHPSKNQQIAGYKMAEINTMSKLYELIHPQDLEFAMCYTVSSINFMNDKGVKLLSNQSRINFRARGKGGKLYYLQRHGIVNGIANGKLVSNFSFIEDVTWMRPTPCTWQMIGPNTESFDFSVPKIIEFDKTLTPRELEILRLVSRGFQSQDISQILNISPHTVNTHRKNMLKKVEVSNTPELMTLARDMGLI